jgi:hypothetical protein
VCKWLVPCGFHFFGEVEHGHIEGLGDVLPSTEYFARMLAKEKISLNVDKHAVDSVRSYAKKHGLRYQALMNRVLSSHAKRLG